jgi:hypothetical protein
MHAAAAQEKVKGQNAKVKSEWRSAAKPQKRA